MLCGPSRSSAPSTAPWPSGKPCSARTRRKIWPSDDAQLGSPAHRCSHPGRHCTQVNCTGYLYTFGTWPRPIQVGRALQRDPRRAARDAGRVDHADRDAGHLPRHPPRPAAARELLLPAVDDPRLPGRDQRADRQPRPPRRHVRAREDLQPRLRHLHRRLAVPGDRLVHRRGGRDLPDRVADRAGRSAARACWPTRPRSSPTRSPPTSAAWRSGSTTSSASAGCSSGSCWAASWRRSTGGWSS